MCVVPETSPRGDCELVADKSVLVKVEDGKLAWRHDVALGVGQHAFPRLAQGRLEDAAHDGVLGAIRAVPCHLQGLGNETGTQVVVVGWR